MNSADMSGKASLLGYAGIIPFLIAIALMLFGGPEFAQDGFNAFLVYGAIILSFLGGIRWGAAATGNSDVGRALAISVMPSLWAALCLLLPSSALSLWGLMTGFVVLGLADCFYPGLRVASWMRPLRARLTLAVVACHVVVIGLTWAKA